MRLAGCHVFFTAHTLVSNSLPLVHPLLSRHDDVLWDQAGPVGIRKWFLSSEIAGAFEVGQ